MLGSIIGGIGKLFVGGLGSTAQGVARGVATFTGDRVQRETNLSNENMEILKTYAAEYMADRQNRTWWDSFTDGLNRLPRPGLALSVMALMAWPVFDPIAFAAAMTAYALVPEWLAWTVLSIIGFYFTARTVENVRSIGKGPTADQVAAVLEAQKSIRDLKPVAPEQYEAAMSDESKPLSNAVIEEWNRRRK